MPGGMMGRMAGGSREVDQETIPAPAVVVIEFESPTKNFKKFETALAPLQVKDRWGTFPNLFAYTALGRAVILKQSDGTPIPSVAKRFQEDFEATFKGTPSAGDVLRLAEWALEHGLIDRFPEVMDKLGDVDKGNAAYAAYQKVKQALDATPTSPPADALRSRVLEGYRPSTTDRHHFLLLHRGLSEDEVRSRLDRLEAAFRGYYYWFALREVVLPVSRERPVAVVTPKEDEFKRLRKVLSAGPVVGEGFFAPREAASVFSGNPRDPIYDSLEMVSRVFWERGFSRQEILVGKARSGVPTGASELDIYQARWYGLLLKAMEYEAEVNSTSHDASRQMLYVSGLLPRNVASPEWILFGMGSLFEVPSEAPWGGPGAPNAYYLPRFKELRPKKLEKTALDTLRRVVTDGYFRQPAAPQSGEPLALLAAGLPGKGDAASTEAGLKKARATAWSLTYFLAQKKRDGLLRYFKELSKMPRDLELDETTLLGCFARAFGAVDANQRVDTAQLGTLANQWFSYVDALPLESDDVQKAVRAYLQEMAALRKGAGNRGGGPGALPGGDSPGSGDDE